MDRLRAKRGGRLFATCPWKFMWRFRRNSKGQPAAAAAAAAGAAPLPTLPLTLPQQEALELPDEPVSKEWSCCFGLHVHTATIMIGLWHLFLNILALCLLAIIWRNPHMVDELDNNYDYSVDLSAPALPTPLSKVEPPIAYRDHAFNYHNRQYQNFDMGGLVCTCMIAITLMLLYGAIKGKPSHLLPFFCLQLFDFAITTLTAAGYVCYLQAMHRLIAESHRVPWREKLLELSPEQLVCVVLVVFVCIVFLKAYAIGIVWRCYKYLNMRQQNVRAFMSCVVPADLAANNLMITEEQRAYSTLLPDYDEAIAQYMKQAPPPSYQVAMSNFRLPASCGHVAADYIVAGCDAMDNNNDTPNNNNTVHFNANTPPMQRAEMSPDNGMHGEAAAATTTAMSTAAAAPTPPTCSSAAATASASSSAAATSTPLPPSYNFTVVLSARDEPQYVDGVVAHSVVGECPDVVVGGGARHSSHDESSA